MSGGAPIGNQNAAKAKVWSAAIKRALERRIPLDQLIKVIDELADKLIDLCAAGDLPALKELGDRLEGKVTQVVAGDADLPPIYFQRVERQIVRPNPEPADG